MADSNVTKVRRVVSDKHIDVDDRLYHMDHTPTHEDNAMHSTHKRL